MLHAITYIYSLTNVSNVLIIFYLLMPLTNLGLRQVGSNKQGAAGHINKIGRHLSYYAGFILYILRTLP